MKVIKTFAKFIVLIILVFFLWYFQLFNKFEKNNVKKIYGIMFSRKTLTSSKLVLNKNNELHFDDKIVTISAYSDNIADFSMHLYDGQDNLIYNLDYSNCFLKEKNICTYLVEKNNVSTIKIDDSKNTMIKINEMRKIRKINNIVLNKFIISLLICFGFILVFYIANKFNVDEKIKRKYKNVNINVAFTIFASVIGIITSILIPLYQVPDEYTHINMTYDERNVNTKFEEVVHKKTGAENVLTHADKKIILNKYFDLSNIISINNSINIPKITIIKHLPQAIGMVFCEIFKLPVFVYVTLVELFALAFYILICNIALKKMPIKKHLMMFIMLLPVAIQQMASFSYDVVLNSFSFLFISYILELKYKNEIITNKILIKILLIILVIAICKVPYALLLILILLLPIDNYRLSFFKYEVSYKKLKEKISKHKIISVSIIGIVISIFFICIIKFMLKIDIGRIFLASITHPYLTIKLYAKTLKIFFPFYLDTISGNLGWFDTKFPFIFQFYVYITMFVLVFINYDNKKYNNEFLSLKDKVLMIFTFLLMFYIIILSMFEWTLKCSNVVGYDKLSVSEYAKYMNILPYIGGVQGRYFIPILPLILIVFNSKKISNIVNNINPILYQILYYFILLVVMTLVLLLRFWI